MHNIMFYIISYMQRETSGVFGEESLHFLKELARRLRDRTGEPDAKVVCGNPAR